MRDIEKPESFKGPVSDDSERLRDYADADSDWFWELDPNFRFTIISKRYEGRSEIRENDLLGQTPWEFADADPATDPVWANFYSKLNRREPFRQFRVCIQNDDSPVFWRISGKPVVAGDGRFVGYRGIATDETVGAVEQTQRETLISDYRGALDNISDGIACFDARNRLIFVNSSFWNLVPASPYRVRPGLTEEAFYSQIDAGIDLINGEEIERPHANIYKRNAVWQTSDGKSLIVDVKPLPSFGYTLTVRRNDRDSDPDTLEDAKGENFEGIVSSSPQGFYVHIDGSIVFANQAAADLFGCSHAEFVGSDILDFAVPEEVPRLSEFASARMEGRAVPEKYTFTARRGDGFPLRAELVVRIGEWQGKTAYHVFVQNRTAEDQALRALSESERRFRNLVEGSIQGYYVHRDWEIVYANSAAAAIFGYELNEFIGLDLLQLITPDEHQKITDLRERRLAGELDVPERYEVGGIRKDGSPLIFETFSRLIDWDGAPALQSTILDITERKNVEAHLLYAKETAERADRAKTEFLGNMSHEFRTPLNAIIGFSQIIRDHMMGPIIPQYEEYADAINSSGNHLLEVVNDLLDVASIESGALSIVEEVVDFEDICKSCERMMRHRAEKSGLTLTLNAPISPVSLRGDKRRLKQILINLIGNAIKFTDAKGHVTVDIWDENDCVCLSVSDTGIGIEPHHLSHVLDPFYRVDTHDVSQREGTGLGLPLVKALTDLHQATLEVTSEIDVGTKVEIRFPPERTVRVQP